jgi:protease-4
MRRLLTTLLLLAFGAGGCRQPFPIDVRSSSLPIDFRANSLPIDFHTPLNLSVDIPPVTQAGPVVAMPVGGQPCQSGPKIALIDVDGLLVNQDMTGLGSLGENPVAFFHEKLIAAANDPEVHALVVRINSPGGGVAATEIMARELVQFRERTGKPIVACLLDVGTGGAYFLAAVCDYIVAQPGTITGGIGVILNHFNLTNTLGLFNVIYQPVKSGANIDIGSQTAAINPENMKLLQAMADEYHLRFRELVITRRPKVNGTESTNFDGRIFTAQQALDRGLIDRIGFLDDAIASARTLGGQPNASVIAFRRVNDPMRSPYSVTPNRPLQNSLIPFSVPGLERSQLPTFLYLWQPDPAIDRQANR